MTEIAKGKYFYGIVTVGERGQIVLPKEAREQFNIKPGDKLMVAGDVDEAHIAIAKADLMKELALRILGAMNEDKASSKEH
jgi:AbrB family looped-hinge helix DNA binding protein